MKHYDVVGVRPGGAQGVKPVGVGREDRRAAFQRGAPA